MWTANLLKIFLETQVKEEKEQDGLLGIIAEKVSEESCTEQCESCQKYCPASEECMATDENTRCTECEYLCKTCGRCETKEEKTSDMIVIRSAKNVDLFAQNVGAVRIQCWNYSQESICFSGSNALIPGSNEAGAEEYTIPASNAFGLPYRLSLSVSPTAACQGESLKPLHNS